MPAEPDIARLARTIGDPTRIRMLSLLMEGRALTAKELAHGANVEPATATSHLQRLLRDQLVISTTQGRHKYFRLASPRVAECIESLMGVALPSEKTVADRSEPIHHARLCYDHLAGKLGTQITAILLGRGLMRLDGKQFVLSPKGKRWLGEFGIDVAAMIQSRRRFAPVCLDWSERRDHLGGALGAALAHRMIGAGWLKRRPGSRVLSVTKSGHDALAGYFGIAWTD